MRNHKKKEKKKIKRVPCLGVGRALATQRHRSLMTAGNTNRTRNTHTAMSASNADTVLAI